MVSIRQSSRSEKKKSAVPESTALFFFLLNLGLRLD